MRLLISILFLLLALLTTTTPLHCTTTTIPTLLLHNISHASLHARSASALKPRLAIPWPQKTHNNHRLHVLKYCYADAYTRSLLHCRVQAGFTLWANALGYPASAATGHGLAWHEADDGNPDPSVREVRFCFLPGLVEGRAVWNPEVERDFVRSSEGLGRGHGASVGYRLGARYTEGMHFMLLNRGAEALDVAHEIGHLLGMSHEFIRSDRDNSLLYTCANLHDYTAALASAHATNPSLSPEDLHTRLCTDHAFALSHSFSGANFIASPLGRMHDDSPALDLDSIMMYASTSFAGEGCPQEKGKCPLLKWVEDGWGFGGREAVVIGRAEGPSEGDVEWVRRWYGWER